MVESEVEDFTVNPSFASPLREMVPTVLVMFPMNPLFSKITDALSMVMVPAVSFPTMVTVAMSSDVPAKETSPMFRSVPKDLMVILRSSTVAMILAASATG